MMLCSSSLCLGCLDVLLPRYLGDMEQGYFLERFCDSQHLSRKISTIFRKEIYNFQERDVVWFIFSMISEEVVWFSTMFRSGCMIFYNFHGKFLQFSGEVAWFSIIFGRGCMNLYNFSGEARGRFALFYIIFQERLCDFISFFRRGCVILYHFLERLRDFFSFKWSVTKYGQNCIKKH